MGRKQSGWKMRLYCSGIWLNSNPERSKYKENITNKYKHNKQNQAQKGKDKKTTSENPIKGQKITKGNQKKYS